MHPIIGITGLAIGDKRMSERVIADSFFVIVTTRCLLMSST